MEVVEFISNPKSHLLNAPVSPSHGLSSPISLKLLNSPSKLIHTHRNYTRNKRRRTKTLLSNCRATASAGSVAAAQVKDDALDVEVYEGLTMTQFCDKIIDLFLIEKPKSKDWKQYLVLREEWKKYRDSFYHRCESRAKTETDPNMRQKLIVLARRVKKFFTAFSAVRLIWNEHSQIDDEMERHTELLKELEDNPTDINSIVARLRKDFTGEFFQHLTLVSEAYDGLEDRDSVARLGAKCLSAVSAYDRTLENLDTLDSAQAKFDDILNSSSVDAACDKIRSLAKAKELNSSLVLLINSAWASAKVSTTMKNEVKHIMYQLYKTTKSSLRKIAPREIKVVKHLLNIVDPEERFSALATAFSPGDCPEAKEPDAFYTAPKELHKWIKIMLDAYHLNLEETEIREAQKMTQPVVIQRLLILKEIIEKEYMEREAKTGDDAVSNDL